MRLYTYFRSSAAFRVRIALNLKGLAYEALPVDIRPDAAQQTRPAFLAVNPEGLVPALEDNGVTLSQSLAIIEYLEEAYPEPPLLPRSPIDRARVRGMALAVACDLHPLNNLRVLSYLRSPLGRDEEAVKAWARHWIAVTFRALEEEARRYSGDGKHLFGEIVTLADVCLIPQMYNARRFKCDLEPYPTLRSIYANLESRPPFAQAAPEAQSDAG
jgi:maleylacetoacetate isomerase